MKYKYGEWIAIRNKRINPEIAYSIALIILLSFAFSGFSFKSDLDGEILCEMLLDEYPGVSLLSKEYDNAGEMYGEMIAENCVPASEYNFMNENVIMTGETSSTIGNRTFSLYDKVIYENEEYGEEGYIYNEEADNGNLEASAREDKNDNEETVEAAALNDSSSKIIKKLYC